MTNPKVIALECFYTMVNSLDRCAQACQGRSQAEKDENIRRLEKNLLTILSNSIVALREG